MSDTLKLTNKQVLELYQGRVVETRTESGRGLSVVPSGADPLDLPKEAVGRRDQ